MVNSNTKEDKNTVKVLGANKEFVSYTHPARARKLIARGKAFILSTNPYTIQIKGRIVGGDNSEREVAMSTQKKKYTSFTQFFKEEKDVWVQNVSKTQISLQFMTGPGQYVGRCIPRTRKPINLSQFVSWDAIKNSNDLKIIVNRRPAKLLLLDEEEAMAYYKKLADEYKTSIDEEIDKAFEEQTMLMDHIIPEIAESAPDRSLSQMQDILAKQDTPVVEDDPQDVLTPRVVGLVEQASEEVPQAERMGARELKEELEVMEDDLTRADLDYLLTHGSKSIQKWASKVKSEKK